MRIELRIGLRIAMASLAIAPLLGQPQSTELHIRYNSGQGVVPIYEGWERVPVARERAAADASASGPERDLRAVAGLSRSGPCDVRARGLREGRRRQGR